MSTNPRNMDALVVKDFGSEWSRFDQRSLPAYDREKIFDDYFHMFPWEKLPPRAVGADIGCGSGRWAVLVAPRVGHLYLVDPSSEALSVAEKNLTELTNISFHLASVDQLPFEKRSLDFAYSIGVLHHVPDTFEAIKSIALTLKPGAPFLIYLYYALDQRPRWFRALWWCSSLFRTVISALPTTIKNVCCDIIAFAVYWPLARAAWVLNRASILPRSWPLAYYRDLSFYVMRTNARDCFGTRLEKRFTRRQIENMLTAAGFTQVRFSDRAPFWCATCFKR